MTSEIKSALFASIAKRYHARHHHLLESITLKKKTAKLRIYLEQHHLILAESVPGIQHASIPYHVIIARVNLMEPDSVDKVFTSIDDWFARQ
jgi:hypothetical protein